MGKIIFISVLLANFAFGGTLYNNYYNKVIKPYNNNYNANTNSQTYHQSIYSNAFCAWYGCISGSWTNKK